MDVDLSLGRWFASRAAISPNRRALTFEGVTWTYGDMQHRIDCLARDLQDGGVCHGDRVAFLGLNQPSFVVTLFATARLGAIFVPLNFRLTGPELAFIVSDAGVHTLVVDAQHREVADSIRADVPVRRFVSEADGDGWDPLVTTGRPLASAEPVGADEVAIIMYTSGTTGLPKGAMLTHANLWWNNCNAMHQFDVLEDDVTLVVTP